jgi:hypothetical protein
MKKVQSAETINTGKSTSLSFNRVLHYIVAYTSLYLIASYTAKLTETSHWMELCRIAGLGGCVLLAVTFLIMDSKANR